MTDTPGVPDHAARVETDARDRAIRTLLQGLLVDLLLAIAVTVTDVVSANGLDWRLLGLALGKTIVMTATSYVARKVAPPAV